MRYKLEYFRPNHILKQIFKRNLLCSRKGGNFERKRLRLKICFGLAYKCLTKTYMKMWSKEPDDWSIWHQSRSLVDWSQFGHKIVPLFSQFKPKNDELRFCSKKSSKTSWSQLTAQWYSTPNMWTLAPENINIKNRKIALTNHLKLSLKWKGNDRNVPRIGTFE